MVKLRTKSTPDRTKGVEVEVYKNKDGKRRVRIVSSGYDPECNVKVVYALYTCITTVNYRKLYKLI